VKHLVGQLNDNLHPSGLISLFLIDFSELVNCNTLRWEENVIEYNKSSHDRYRTTAVFKSKPKKGLTKKEKNVRGSYVTDEVRLNKATRRNFFL
jgi:hypothetical protein